MRRFSDPYRTTARFNSTCSQCGKTLTKGDPIVYDKMRKLVYCLSEDENDCGSQILRDVQAERSMDQYGTDVMYDY